MQTPTRRDSRGAPEQLPAPRRPHPEAGTAPPSRAARRSWTAAGAGRQEVGGGGRRWEEAVTRQSRSCLCSEGCLLDFAVCELSRSSRLLSALVAGAAGGLRSPLFSSRGVILSLVLERFCSHSGSARGSSPYPERFRALLKPRITGWGSGGEGAARGAKQTTAPSMPRAPVADWRAGRRRSRPRDAIGGGDGRGRGRRPFTPSMKERSGSDGPKKSCGPKKLRDPKSGPGARRCGYERSVAVLAVSPSRRHAGGRLAVLPSGAGGAFGMRRSAGRGGKGGAPPPHCPTGGPRGALGFGFPPRCSSWGRLAEGCVVWEVPSATDGAVPIHRVAVWGPQRPPELLAEGLWGTVGGLGGN